MSIRSRLLLLVLVIVLLAASFIARRFVQEREREVQEVTLRLAAVASEAAGALDERIQGTEQLHYGLARSRDLDTRDRGACSRFLSGVRGKYPQYTGILSIDPDGKLFCDSLNTGRELNLNDRDYFKRVRTATDTIAMQAAFGRLSNLAVLQIAYPVRSETGDLKFVLLASVNLQLLADTSLKTAKLPGAQIVMLGDDGVVLTWAGGAAGGVQPGASLSGTPLMRFAQELGGDRIEEIAGANGEMMVWAAADPSLARGAGVHVLVGYPKKVLVAPADRQLLTSLSVLAAAAAIALIFIWFFVEVAIRRPIAAIAGMVRRLGNNEPGARIPEPHPRGELGELMKVLNASAQAQEAQRAQLQDANTKLREAQRLESIGQLTGGVAHDFNNLLTVIMGNAEVLSEKLKDHPPLAGMAAMVLDAAERGAELTQRLLAFARKQALAPQSVDLNQRVAAMEALLSRTIGEHIEIRLAPGQGLWPAMVDPAQLDNALINLCVNSRDAMPQGGLLTIETANASLSDDYARLNADVAAGDYVMLAVSDTGTGIAPEIQARVFEPFFTTKEQGKGTGLGMAMVYGFAKQSGGHVALYSELGRGTCVKLFFPRAPGGAPATGGDTAGDVAGGAETILLVEDDAQVRRFASGQLRSLGYEVIEAQQASQALEIIHGGRTFDLLFTDLVMPGMSGRDLVEQARKLRPDLKVLYTSGYTENALIHQGRLDEGVQLLAKPYRREQLARRVRAALA